jgi:hypothetical protein
MKISPMRAELVLYMRKEGQTNVEMDRETDRRIEGPESGSRFRIYLKESKTFFRPSKCYSSK